MLFRENIGLLRCVRGEERPGENGPEPIQRLMLPLVGDVNGVSLPPRK